MRRRRLPLVVLALSLAAALTVGCQKGGSGAAPTDALKAYVEAASKKDTAGMKSRLSKRSLEMMENGAKALQKNVDDVLKEDYGETAPNPADIKYSNEKVSGDTATVDMTAQGQTISMPLVKEDGEWKIALDKLIEEMKKKMGG